MDQPGASGGPRAESRRNLHFQQFAMQAINTAPRRHLDSQRFPPVQPVPARL